MGLFEHFPYSNFHQLNIDWVLEKVKYCLAQVAAFATRLDDAEDDIADLQSAVSNLQTALEALRTNLQNQINTLGERVTTNENDIDTLETAMAAAESDIDTLEASMVTAESDIAALETSMATAENDIDALETSMATAENDIDALEAFTSSGSNDLITSHTASGAVGVVSKRRGYTRLYEIDFTVPDNASSVTFVFTNVVNGNYIWPIYRALGNGSYESAGLIQAHTGSCYVGNLTGGESYVIQALIM